MFFESQQQRRNAMKRKSRQAFTLMEMLVTISIMLVLAALLIPGFASVRESARSAACLSNLKQLAAGCLAYSADNDNVLVPIARGTSSADAKSWRALIAPYVGTDAKVFKCPADSIGMRETYNAQGFSPSSYGVNYNKAIIGTALVSQLHEYLGLTVGRRLSSVTHPANTIMICDVGLVRNPAVAPQDWVESSQHDRLGNRNGLGYARFPTDPQFTGGDAWNIYPRHWKRKANVAFYDGHAASVDVQYDILDHSPGDGACLYSNE